MVFVLTLVGNWNYQEQPLDFWIIKAVNEQVLIESISQKDMLKEIYNLFLLSRTSQKTHFLMISLLNFARLLLITKNSSILAVSIKNTSSSWAGIFVCVKKSYRIGEL